MLDAATLILRRVRRSARKSFHVNCWGGVVAGLVGEEDAADGAVEACRMAVAMFDLDTEAKDARVVPRILVCRVEVVNEAVAQHGAMRAAGWRRTQKARAGRRVLVESIVDYARSGRGGRCVGVKEKTLFGSTRIFQKFDFLAGKVLFFRAKQWGRQRQLPGASSASNSKVRLIVKWERQDCEGLLVLCVCLPISSNVI